MRRLGRARADASAPSAPSRTQRVPPPRATPSPATERSQTPLRSDPAVENADLATRRASRRASCASRRRQTQRWSLRVNRAARLSGKRNAKTSPNRFSPVSPTATSASVSASQASSPTLTASSPRLSARYRQAMMRGHRANLNRRASRRHKARRRAGREHRRDELRPRRTGSTATAGANSTRRTTPLRPPHRPLPLTRKGRAGPRRARGEQGEASSIRTSFSHPSHHLRLDGFRYSAG